jgi:hypothetical protein
VDNEERRKHIEKIEKIDLQISLLNDIKQKLVNKLDTSHKHKEEFSAINLSELRNLTREQKHLESSIDKINLFRSLFRGRDDAKISVLWKMYKRRLKTYKAMGYSESG